MLLPREIYNRLNERRAVLDRKSDERLAFLERTKEFFSTVVEIKLNYNLDSFEQFKQISDEVLAVLGLTQQQIGELIGQFIEDSEVEITYYKDAASRLLLILDQLKEADLDKKERLKIATEQFNQLVFCVLEIDRKEGTENIEKFITYVLELLSVELDSNGLEDGFIISVLVTIVFNTVDLNKSKEEVRVQVAELLGDLKFSDQANELIFKTMESAMENEKGDITIKVKTKDEEEDEDELEKLLSQKFGE